MTSLKMRSVTFDVVVRRECREKRHSAQQLGDLINAAPQNRRAQVVHDIRHDDQVELEGVDRSEPQAAPASPAFDSPFTGVDARVARPGAKPMQHWLPAAFARPYVEYRPKRTAEHLFGDCDSERDCPREVGGGADSPSAIPPVKIGAVVSLDPRHHDPLNQDYRCLAIRCRRRSCRHARRATPSWPSCRRFAP